MKYSLILLPVLLFSCAMPAVQPLQNNISLSQSSQISTGANLSVNVNFTNFKTKASANGVAAKTVNDIKSAKLYLTTSNGTNPLLAANIKYSSGILVYPTGTTTKTYTFFNVPAGTYFVAAELFSDTAGTNNIVESLSYDSTVAGDTAFGMNGKRGLTLSTNSATVTAPTMTYTFSDSSNSFSVSPKLLNALGASLDTTINPQAGSSNPTNAITLQ